MFAANSVDQLSAVNIVNLSTIIEPIGPVFNGPGASRPCSPFILRVLELHERECIEKAKKYAMEQSIRAVLIRQTQSQQSTQLSNIKKNQTVSLLNRVYVGSISYEVEEESLKQAFLPFGPLKAVTMSWDPATQKHKGFAFLEYEYPEAAQLSIEQMNGLSFGGRQLKVGRPSNLLNAEEIIADLVTEYKLQNRIYVAGIHVDLTEDDISLVFEAFGKIKFCRLLPDPAGLYKHRGFGYVEYDNYQSVTDALNNMNQFNLGDQLLRVCRATSPLEGFSSPCSSGLPPAVAVAAASATARVLSMETEQLPINSTGTHDDIHDLLLANSGGSNVALNFISDPALSQTKSRQTGFSQHKSDLVDPHIPIVTDFKDALSTQQQSSSPPQAWELEDISEEPKLSTISSVSPIADAVPGVLILRNMVGADDCDDELEDEVRSECSTYGLVERVVLYQEVDPDNGGVIVKVFVLFGDVASLHKAIESLNGRYFAGRKITAEEYSLEAFKVNDLSF